MADNLDDGEFWLPPQFLDDDEAETTLFRNGDRAVFPNEFPFGFGSFGSGVGGGSSSDLSSPFGGSSETESDEEEHHLGVAELTRRMTRSTLDADNKPSEKSTRGLLSGSPQSTLCAFGSGCGCRKGSSQGSPNSVCEKFSVWATWDLLHAAAGEVERMRLNQEGYAVFGNNHSHNHNNKLLVPSRNLSPVNSTNTTNPDVGFFNQQSLSHQQLQIAQFQMLRKQQMEKHNSVWGVQNHQSGGVYQHRPNNQVAPNGRRGGDVGGGRSTRPLSLSPYEWPPLQHAKRNPQFGSGMRAVFLNNPNGRRECAGTGVFLPRCVDSPAASRKNNKPACSTVLVPARVAQALNLKLDDMVGGQTQHMHRINLSSMENAAASVPKLRNNHVQSQQIRNNRLQQAMNPEITLPAEWTY